MIPCVQGSPNCVNGMMGLRAGTGYDLTTGLGSVDANKLITGWSMGTASSLKVVADPPTAAPADTIRLTATVSGTAGGTPPTGSVSFVSNLYKDLPLGEVEISVYNGIATATMTFPASSVILDDGSVTAIYSGDKNYDSSAGSVTVAYKKTGTGSLVVPLVTPNPVYRQSPYGNWPYSVVLSEKNGVATTLTLFTVNNVTQSIAGDFGTTVLPAHGMLIANLAGNNLTVPINRAFHFEGKDADGTVWKQDFTVPFLEAVTPSQNPGISLTSTPTAVTQNPQSHGPDVPVVEPAGGAGDRRFPGTTQQLEAGEHGPLERHAGAVRDYAAGTVGNAARHALPGQQHDARAADLYADWYQ